MVREIFFGRTNTRALSLAFGIGVFLTGITKSAQVTGLASARLQCRSGLNWFGFGIGVAAAAPAELLCLVRCLQ